MQDVKRGVEEMKIFGEKEEIKRQKGKAASDSVQAVKLFSASICLCRGGDVWTSLTHLHLNDKLCWRRVFRSPRHSPFWPSPL